MTFGCPLEDAFNKPFKKKSKKFRNADDQLNKILNRGSDIDDKIIPYGPKNDSLSLSYDNNNETVKLQDKIKHLEQKNRDLEPND